MASEYLDSICARLGDGVPCRVHWLKIAASCGVFNHEGVLEGAGLDWPHREIQNQGPQLIIYSMIPNVVRFRIFNFTAQIFGTLERLLSRKQRYHRTFMISI